MRRLILIVALTGFFAALWGISGVRAASGSALQAAPSAPQPAGQKQHPALRNPADYVGSDTCEACHADLSKKFGTNPHSRLALMHGGKGVTCENCHGPGKAHVDGGGDITKILRFTTASTKQIDETCLGCHASAHPDFERSGHAKAGVSCASCHSIHKFENETSLLKVSQPKLCFGCHTDVKPAFSQPFHHKVNEGLMTCSDCHDPHGTMQPKALKTTHDQNAVCTKCHTETAGPFVFEHPVLKTEGCTSCHSPHGSPNARLLNVSNVNTLCLQCHSGINSGAFPSAVSPTGPAHNQATQYVACTNCHTQIHGSHTSPIFFK